MCEIGLPASASDAGVAALCGRSAVMGAFLNVKINTADLEDDAAITDYFERGQKIQDRAEELEREIIAIVHEKMVEQKGG